MAAKVVFDLCTYALGQGSEISMHVEIKFSQDGVSNLYHNGRLIRAGVRGDFTEELPVNRGDKVKLVTTVADISPNTDNTGLDVMISGGTEELTDEHNEKADRGDIVTYDLTYYMT